METVVLTIMLVLISFLFTEIVATYTMKAKLGEYRFKKNIYRLVVVTLTALVVMMVWLMIRQ